MAVTAPRRSADRRRVGRDGDCRGALAHPRAGGRVAKAGAPRPDARSTPPKPPCVNLSRRTSEPRSSSAWRASRLPERRGRADDFAEVGKPLKAAKVEAARAMSTFTMAAVEARKLAGEMVPMTPPGRRGKLAFTLRLPIGVVGAISPFQLPAQSRRPQDRAGARRRLRGRAETGVADSASRFCSRSSTEAGLPGWLNVLSPGRRDWRRARRGRARASDHVHRPSEVGWKLERARASGSARAGNATPRSSRRQRSRRCAASCGERVLVRRPAASP